MQQSAPATEYTHAAELRQRVRSGSAVEPWEPVENATQKILRELRYIIGTMIFPGREHSILASLVIIISFVPSLNLLIIRNFSGLPVTINGVTASPRLIQHLAEEIMNAI